MAGIFNRFIFNNAIFNTGAVSPSILVVPSGVRGAKKPPVIRMREVVDRASTAEFLKSHLRQNVAKEAIKNMKIEAKTETRISNNNIVLMMEGL